MPGPRRPRPPWTSWSATGTDLLLDTFYARAFLDQDQGSGSALVEWEGGADYVVIGGAPIDRSVDASYVVEVRDVFLNAGQNYSIQFNTTGANLQMFLFDPGTSWSGAAQRSSSTRAVPPISTIPRPRPVSTASSSPTRTVARAAITCGSTRERWASTTPPRPSRSSRVSPPTRRVDRLASTSRSTSPRR